MSIVSMSKYLVRQAKQVATFGEKTVERNGVTKEILDDITPFRRLSGKKGTLSDPKYFIEKFENETGSNFLPQMNDGTNSLRWFGNLCRRSTWRP